MNILVALPAIYSEIGGGQRFYANLIASNPDVQFYVFEDSASAVPPPNARALRLGDHYRGNSGQFDLGGLPGDSPAGAIQNHADELALLMDMAAAVPPLHFDIVDIPDFLPLAVYFPECLHYFGIACDRVALSMHGTLSMGLFDNWDEGIGGLESLIEHEELLYRYADLRYGIGRRYIAEWSEKIGLPAQLLDIGQVYALSPPGPPPGSVSNATPPDLCFIGRQEKWKGPDLFLELCSQLPRSSFGQIRLFGPSVNLHGNDSMEALRRLAHNRSLDIVHEIVAPDQIAARLRHDRIVVVLPSRRDTFNLVALEALLSGCPTVVSTGCGACDFLDTAYPGLPYVKLDPGDLLGGYDGILSLLTDYDAARAALVAYLAQARRQDYGVGLAQVYGTESRPEPAARRIIEARFQAFADWLAADFQNRIAQSCASRVREQCAEVLSAHDGAMIDQDSAEREFWHAVDVNRVCHEAMASRGGGWSAVDDALKRLQGYVFGGSRIALYRLMAEWERRRGNELLYATYWLRIMRLSGEIPNPVLRQVTTILEAHGFAEEARVAEIMQRNDEEEIYRYLAVRSDRLRTPPRDGIATAIEFDRPQSPRVSVIVSVYRGADKVGTFVAGLERFTDETKRLAEFIFIDSASPDDTHAVLTERLKLAASRGIGSLYLRSERRETIQRAWNRGIDAARGRYLAFLGVDEMDRPDALAKMAAFLDRRPDIDWVQGSAVITEVNAAGSYVRDIMAYDRRFDTRHIHYLECCYVSYVGALYRKSIHAKIGFYDDGFRGAGDTEFKNRALPFIGVATLPETLGTFLNYPEERTTQSPTAELEDLRAWYLHRTAGGVRYAFDNEADDAGVRHFRHALHYRKSYMEGICTDVDYALAIAAYLKRHRPAAFAEIEVFVPNLVGLQLAYQRLDLLTPPERASRLGGFEAIVAGLKQTWFAVAQAHSVHRQLGLPAEYRIANDNRWHQHLILWPSTPATPAVAATAAKSPNGAAHSQPAALGITGRLGELAREAVATIIRGDPLTAPALGALCSLSTAAAAEDMLHSLVVEGLAAAPRHWSADTSADLLLQDVRAVIGSYFGTADDAAAVLSPALPFDIIDAAGQMLPARTEAARLGRGRSWRLPLPANREQLRIQLDARFSIEGHPGAIRFKGFYQAEHQQDYFRWTGPAQTSTITIPLALNCPAGLVVELGSTGPNTASEDFTIACNGAVVSHTLATHDQKTTLTADLSPSFLTGPVTEIALTVKECTSAVPPDERVLGVVFHSLTLFLGMPGGAAASPAAAPDAAIVPPPELIPFAEREHPRP